MFILKTIGTDKVPDYIQVRDNSFKLLEILKISTFEKKIISMYKESIAKEIIKTIESADYGKLIQMEQEWKK